MSDSAIMHLLRRDEKSLVRDGGLYFVAEMSESFSRTFGFWVIRENSRSKW
jgi:hypothetical protein